MGEDRRMLRSWSRWPKAASNRGWFASLALGMLIVIASRFYTPLAEAVGFDVGFNVLAVGAALMLLGAALVVKRIRSARPNPS